jgi:hypothetical protein
MRASCCSIDESQDELVRGSSTKRVFKDDLVANRSHRALGSKQAACEIGMALGNRSHINAVRPLRGPHERLGKRHDRIQSTCRSSIIVGECRYAGIRESIGRTLPLQQHFVGTWSSQNAQSFLVPSQLCRRLRRLLLFQSKSVRRNSSRRARPMLAQPPVIPRIDRRLQAFMDQGRPPEFRRSSTVRR